MGKDVHELSFWEHLDELRSRLLRVLAAFVLCSVVFYNFVDYFLAFIVRPVDRLVFISPAEAFTSRLKIAFLGGFFLSLPFIFYEVWAFVSVGLTEKEKQLVRILAPFSFFCFVGGVLFGYFVMVPISLKFLLSFASPLMVPMITVGNYISFVTTFVLAFGITFELPVVLIFLSRAGIIQPEFLVRGRRYAIVLIFIVSAILTPPDVASQILMAIPLMILYELSVWLSKWACQDKTEGRPHLPDER